MDRKSIVLTPFLFSSDDHLSDTLYYQNIAKLSPIFSSAGLSQLDNNCITAPYCLATQPD